MYVEANRHTSRIAESMLRRMEMSGTADRYKKLLEKVQSLELGSSGFWKPPSGRSTIRILPPIGTMEYFFMEVGQHFLEGTGTFYCPKICSDGKDPCPVCDVNDALFQAGDKESAKKFWAQRHFWCNVIVRGNEDAGPQTFTPGTMVFTSLVSLISDPDYGDITDPDEGYDIKIERSGEGINTRYEVRAAKSPSVLSDDDEEVDEWLETARDIYDMVSKQIKTYDDLAKASGVDVYLDSELVDEDGVPEAKEEPEEDEPASKTIERRLQQRRKARR